ncbi:hypothetical protein phytr_10170 [Candidatus Phycorickettsia trachydisci]|uniref:Uncharacterized protein n=1 Tax=Candidatus Phycorickettsia trachydisci TaxID=2115978 RepID=A0A2P1P9L8_9RICK|nr:hypothetical protein [Candidatus Phycorickettsia trachydisci]AVP87945.1 hypothetical protein phytr_10170 [Candidatus Phycorickettsia trachydisci]
MRNQTRVCNCIAFHNFNYADINWRAWHEYCLSIFAKHNVIPNQVLVRGLHYGNSSKPKGLKAGLNKLEKFNFEGIEALDYSLKEEGAEDVDNVIMSIYISSRTKNPHSSKAVFCIDEKLEPFIQSNFEDLAAGFFNAAKVRYGYYYNRMLKDDASSYMFGGHISYLNPEEKRRFKIWSHAFIHEKYKTGDLRDIYKLNFLSREHLVRDIRHTDQQSSSTPITLESLINSSPVHGELKQLREGFWSWYVPDEYIESVRNALIPSGIILCV